MLRSRARFRFLSLFVASVAVMSGMTSVSAADPQIERVSISSSGVQADGASDVYSWTNHRTISENGRFVVFQSSAHNLTGVDSNRYPDIYVFDRQTRQVDLVTVTSQGIQANMDSHDPSISADGRFVSFYSWATNLAPNDTNRSADVFVYDRETHTLELISTTPSGEPGNKWSSNHVMSADGRYVAFASGATNLMPDQNQHLWSNVFVRDRVAGTTRSVSEATGEEFSYPMWVRAISGNGRYVFFTAYSYSGGEYTYVFDQETNQVERLSAKSTYSYKWPYLYSENLSASTDGRFVALEITAPLAPGDNNSDPDIYVYDRDLGTVDWVSSSYAGTAGEAASYYPSISGDGQYVTFYSAADDLVVEDNNGVTDVFLFDRETRVLKRISTSWDETQSDGNSDRPSISLDGQHVTFRSVATNLVPEDTNGVADIFVYGQSGFEVGMPPQTTAQISPTANAHNWHNSSVTVRLQATGDAPVREIGYRVGDTAESVIPGDSAEFSLATEGVWPVQYWAVSQGGQREAPNEVTVQIDMTSPTAGLYLDSSAIVEVDDDVALRCSANDALSGLVADPCSDLKVIVPAYEMGVGEHTIMVTAEDKAGNSTSVSVDFTVTVSSDSLCSLTKKWVTKQGVANSLCTKLKAAGSRSTSGPLQAFENELRAQTDKSIARQHAETLIRLARDLAKVTP